VRRLASGEDGALEDAYRLYAGHCRAIAYRILRDAGSAQDAVQEAFLTLWRHRAGLVVRTAGVKPWLAVVVRNAALNMIRSRERRFARESAAAPEEQPGDPLELVAAGSDADAVRAAMSALPEEQRTVIRLAYFARLTLAQIA